MGIGRLDKRITIQESTDSDQGGGVVTKTWTDLATVWASVDPQRGNEYYEGQQVRSEVTYRVRIRAPLERSGGTEVRPTADMRFTYDSRTFRIEEVRDLREDGRYYELMAIEQTT